MLIDNVIITIKAGNGGNGSVSFRRNAQTAKGGPDGGNGGNGGNVYFVGTNDVTALQRFRYQKVIKAEDGVRGQKKNLYGRNGTDTIIAAPLGTMITDQQTQQTYEIVDETTQILLAQGGKGGRGNNEFKSALNQTPKYAETGTPGEEKILMLELKLIADIGLIGLPNAGKSSILKTLTNAHPKIGDYPFTTLEPNLGVFEHGLVIADIPGIIAGASKGKGLGIQFLKHIEKTKLLVHCIDSTSQHLLADYEVIKKEFEQYSTTLLGKEQLIVLTKTDLITQEELTKKIKTVKKLKKEVIALTIYDEKSVDEFKQTLKHFHER